MSEAKHSPAPWEICEHSWSDTGIYATKERSTAVCRLSIGDEADEENQSELEARMRADSRLIAAAPELLEALYECESWMRCECGHPACKRCRATKEAHEVISKATGKEYRP